jgi:hypothetical protein
MCVFIRHLKPQEPHSRPAKDGDNTAIPVTRAGLHRLADFVVNPVIEAVSGKATSSIKGDCHAAGGIARDYRSRPHCDQKSASVLAEGSAYGRRRQFGPVPLRDAPLTRVGEIDC